MRPSKKKRSMKWKGFGIDGVVKRGRRTDCKRVSHKSFQTMCQTRNVE